MATILLIHPSSWHMGAGNVKNRMKKQRKPGGIPQHEPLGRNKTCQSFVGGFPKGCARKTWSQLLPEKS